MIPIIQKITKPTFLHTLFTLVAVASISITSVFFAPQKAFASGSPDLVVDGTTYTFTYANAGSNDSNLIIKATSKAGVTGQIELVYGQSDTLDSNQDYYCYTSNSTCNNSIVIKPFTSLSPDPGFYGDPNYFELSGYDQYSPVQNFMISWPTPPENPDDFSGVVTYPNVHVHGGGEVSGSSTWLDAQGHALSYKTNQTLSRFNFISPTDILDTVTNVNYTTDSSMFANNGQRFINDGPTIYWPSNGVQHGNQCYGGITVDTEAIPNYGVIRLLPTAYFGSNSQNNAGSNGCYFGSTSQNNAYSVDDYPATHYGYGGQPEPGGSALENPANVIDLPSANQQMLYAMFYWSDSSQILAYGGGAQLAQVDPTSTFGGDALSYLKSKFQGQNDNWEIFTATTVCENSSTSYPSFLAINYDDNSPITNLDFSDSNSTANFFYQNTSTSSWQNGWDNGQLNCLFSGGEPNWSSPQENHTSATDNDPGYTYVAQVGQSVSATPVVPPGSKAPPTTPEELCQAGGFNLSWILCPILNSMASAEHAVEGVIGKLLVTPVVQFNNNNCNSTSQNKGDCVFNAWSELRVYGDLLLLVGLLVAVLIEAFGGGIAEAYTVKKMLPRILVAAILINLSVYLVAGLEDVANVFGQGIYNILHTAFYGGTSWQLTPNSFSSDISTTGFAAVIAVALTSGEALAFFGAFVLLPAVFAVVAVLFTIIIRQGLLLLLLITSPIAFALYCLPNTEKYFQKWWDLLFKTLLVYPIMMTLFAVGDISYALMTYISRNVASSSSDSWLAGLLPIIALIAPLFLTIFAFRLAGGVIGNIHGALHSYGQKAHQAILGNPNDKNSLRNRVKRNLAIKHTARGLTPGQIGTRLNPRQITAEGRRNARSRIGLQREVGFNMLRENVEQTGLWQEVAKDSNILKVLAEHKTGASARRALNASGLKKGSEEYERRSAAIAGAERIGFNPSTRRAALMNANYIGFEVAPGSEGWENSVGIMRDLSKGNPFAFRSMMDEYQAVAKGPAQRTDLSANTDGDVNYNLDRATGNQNLYTLLNGKPRAVEGLIDEHVERLRDTSGYLTKRLGSTDPQKIAQATTPQKIAQARRQSAQFLAEMRTASNKNQGSAAARDSINGRLQKINQTYDAYLNGAASSEYDRIARSSDRSINAAEAVQVTVPSVTTPGATETRREVRPISLGQATVGTPMIDDQRNELKRRINQQITDTEARAYTPPDINNVNP